jgi:ubiquinone/menaquinone biosynthesis C-methylase UbiE
MRWIKKQLGRQLSQPTGFWGLIVGKFMNKHNRLMYSDAYQLLDASPKDIILEIGFGNGAFIKELVMKIEPGKYYGIDISDTMIRTATKRNNDLIKSGKVELLKNNLEQLSFSNQQFDEVFTLNTIYFWKDPTRIMREIKRVLKPGGTFVVGLSTKEKMEGGGYFHERFTLYDKADVEKLFVDNGFRIIESTYRETKPEDVLCISGHLLPVAVNNDF